jgi:hypothetical protein
VFLCTFAITAAPPIMTVHDQLKYHFYSLLKCVEYRHIEKWNGYTYYGQTQSWRFFKNIMDSHIIAKEAFFSYTCHLSLVLYYIVVRSLYDDHMKNPDPNYLWLKFNILVGSNFSTSIAPLIMSLCHPLHWQIYPLVSDALYRPIGQRTGDTLVIQYFIIAFFPVVFP